jgi:DNA-binding GntR family transcriptional regulator
MQASPTPPPADATTARPTLRLAESVYRQLREDIFDFRLLPGDRFAENDVADRLAVSRTPVREALMRLQSEGLVRCYFRNGWEVIPIDLSRFEALYELREMIELHAVRKLCAGAASPAYLAALGAPWRVPASERLRDGLVAAAQDEAFHIALVGGAGNPETEQVHRQITERIRILRRLDFAYGDCIDETYEDHVAILDAIAAGDAAMACTTIARHIAGSLSVVREISIARLEQARTAVKHVAPSEAARRKRFG